MCVSLWDMNASSVLLQRAMHHTEFVMGVDFSLTAPPLLVSCSWDGAVCAWAPAMGAPGAIPKLPGSGGAAQPEGTKMLPVAPDGSGGGGPR